MVNDYGLRKCRIAKPVDPTLRPTKGKLAECWACPSLWVNYYSNKMEKVERKEIGGGVVVLFRIQAIFSLPGN